MGQCFLEGRGSPEGAAYRILSGLETPRNAQDGDIWVETDVPVTGYTITSECLADLSGLEITGHLILSGTSSKAIPSAGMIRARDGTVLFSPGRICQFDGEKWTALSAKLRKGGNWYSLLDNWDGKLYWDGDEMTDYTGGWVGGGDDVRGNELFSWSGRKIESADTYFKTRTGVYIPAGKKTLVLTGRAGTQNSKGVSTGNGRLKLSDKDKKPVLSAEIKNEEGEQRFDLSGLGNGPYTIRIDGGLGDGTDIIDISRIWLE